jgi:undecaprenyl-diphosphatase
MIDPNANPPSAAVEPLPRDHLMLAEHRVAFGIAILFALAAVFFMIVMAVDQWRDAAQVIDDAVRDFALSIRWHPITVVAVVLSFVGSGWVTWPLRVAVAVWLGVKHRWETFWVWVVAIAIYEPLIGLLKVAYARERPPDPLVATYTFAFPSGHATVGAAIAIGLVIVLVPAGPWRRRLEFVAAVFAFVMAFSRVYLDAHWFSDVVTGTAIGAAVMLGVASAVHELGDRAHRRRISREMAERQSQP